MLNDFSTCTPISACLLVSLFGVVCVCVCVCVRAHNCMRQLHNQINEVNCKRVEECAGSRRGGNTPKIFSMPMKRSLRAKISLWLNYTKESRECTSCLLAEARLADSPLSLSVLLMLMLLTWLAMLAALCWWAWVLVVLVAFWLSKQKWW